MIIIFVTNNNNIIVIYGSCVDKYDTSTINNMNMNMNVVFYFIIYAELL